LLIPYAPVELKDDDDDDDDDDNDISCSESLNMPGL
jgi:hypothetical protein